MNEEMIRKEEKEKIEYNEKKKKKKKIKKKKKKMRINFELDRLDKFFSRGGRDFF